jgi:hypothetical protein
MQAKREGVSVMTYFKSSKELAAAFGCTNLLELLDDGEYLEATPDGKIKVITYEGEELCAVKVPTAALNLASKGCLGPVSMSGISKSIVEMVSNLKAVVPTFEDISCIVLDDDSGESVAPKSATKAKKAKATSKDSPSPVEAKALSVADIMAQEAVLLKDATVLYEPVKGSSSGSVYYCVGISVDESVKVAARVRNSGEVSIRIEGDINSHAGSISDAGLAVHNSNYASIHVNGCTDTTLAGKVVGSVLGCLGVEYKTLAPNLKYIYGAE